MNQSDSSEYEFGLPSGDEGPQSATPALRGLRQLSLAELFFAVTLSAVALWLYATFGSFMAMLAAGCLVVVASIRWFGNRHAVLSGLFGYGSAMVVSLLIAGLQAGHVSVQIMLILVGPAVGYLVGAMMSVLADDWQ